MFKVKKARKLINTFALIAGLSMLATTNVYASGNEEPIPEVVHYPGEDGCCAPDYEGYNNGGYIGVPPLLIPPAVHYPGENGCCIPDYDGYNNGGYIGVPPLPVPPVVHYPGEDKCCAPVIIPEEDHIIYGPGVIHYPGEDKCCAPDYEETVGIPPLPIPPAVHYPGEDGCCIPEYAGCNYSEDGETPSIIHYPGENGCCIPVYVGEGVLIEPAVNFEGEITLIGYDGYSLVEGLKMMGYDSSFEARTKIANFLGINDYMGTYEQNAYMLETLKNSSILLEPMVPAAYTLSR